MIPLLRLARFPNTLTTLADVMAGVALGLSVTDRTVDALEVGLVGLAAMLLYGFGAILNDFVDLPKDRELHPHRPLPSGAVSMRAARTGLALCLIAALAILWALGMKLLLAGVALAGSVFLYDRVLDKGRISAALSMGVCRGLSLSFGAILAGAWGPIDSLTSSVASWLPVVAAIGYAGLITLVTLISIHEEDEAGSARPRALLCLLGLAYLVPVFYSAHPWASLIGATLLAGWVLRPATGATPSYGLVVRNAVFTVAVYDALIASGRSEWVLAVACLGIFPLSRIVARGLGQRGS